MWFYPSKMWNGMWHMCGTRSITSPQQGRSGRLSRRSSRSITSPQQGRSGRLSRRSSRSITSPQPGRSGGPSRRSFRSITTLQQGRSGRPLAFDSFLRVFPALRQSPVDIQHRFVRALPLTSHIQSNSFSNRTQLRDKRSQTLASTFRIDPAACALKILCEQSKTKAHQKAPRT